MPDSTALVVNHENIPRCFYRGSDPSFLLAGALFRLGGAAALLSNRRACPCIPLRFGSIEQEPHHTSLLRMAVHRCEGQQLMRSLLTQAPSGCCLWQSPLMLLHGVHHSS